jgi:hypothetical protein
MPQFAESFGLYLADALSGDAEVPAHLFQGSGASILETESKLKHLSLAFAEGEQNIVHLLFEQLV